MWTLTFPFLLLLVEKESELLSMTELVPVENGERHEQNVKNPTLALRFLHFSVWQHVEFWRGHCLKFAGRLCANIILLRTCMLRFVFCPRQQPCITSLMTAELSKQLQHNKLEKSPDRPDSLKLNLGYNLKFLVKKNKKQQKPKQLNKTSEKLLFLFLYDKRSSKTLQHPGS